MPYTDMEQHIYIVNKHYRTTHNISNGVNTTNAEHVYYNTLIKGRTTQRNAMLPSICLHHGMANVSYIHTMVRTLYAVISHYIYTHDAKQKTALQGKSARAHGASTLHTKRTFYTARTLDTAHTTQRALCTVYTDGRAGAVISLVRAVMCN